MSEEVKQLPDGWVVKKLGEIIEINNSSVNKNDKFEFINYLDTGNITEGRIRGIDKLIIGSDKIPSRCKRKVKIGDILYSTVRPNQKHYGYINSVFENMLVSTGFCVITTNKSKAHDKFIYYYLTQKLVIDHLQSIAEQSKATYPSINPPDLTNLDINLPPPEEQREIAAVLSALDDKIEINQQINKKLEEMAQAIFKQWFIDFNFPDENGNPYKDSGGAMIDSELGQIPAGWAVLPLIEISEIQNGYAFKSDDYKDSGTKMLRTMNITDTGYLNDNQLKYLPKHFYTDKKYSKFKLEKFDTLLVMVGASIGKIGLITDDNLPSLQNQNMWRFRAKNCINKTFVHYMVKHVNEQVKGWANGSGRDFYTKESFSKAKIYIGDNMIMTKFNEIQSKLYEKINVNLQDHNRLEMIRNLLLPKLMSGETKIFDLRDLQYA